MHSRFDGVAGEAVGTGQSQVPPVRESHHSDRLYPLDIVAAKRYARSAQILVVAFSYTCKDFQFSPDVL